MSWYSATDSAGFVSGSPSSSPVMNTSPRMRMTASPIAPPAQINNVRWRARFRAEAWRVDRRWDFGWRLREFVSDIVRAPGQVQEAIAPCRNSRVCLLYTSDAADDLTRVD